MKEKFQVIVKGRDGHNTVLETDWMTMALMRARELIGYGIPENTIDVLWLSEEDTDGLWVSIWETDSGGELNLKR